MARRFSTTFRSSQDLLSFALDFFQKYSEHVLFKVRLGKVDEFTENKFISASLLKKTW